MGLFNFLRKAKEEKKEEKLVDFDEIKAFSFVAIDLAIPEIESTGSFLPPLGGSSASVVLKSKAPLCNKTQFCPLYNG